MTLRDNRHSQKYLLISSTVPYSVVRGLVGHSHVVDFIHIDLLILSQTITMLDLEIFIIKMMNKILTNITQRNNILQLFLQFSHQHTILIHLHQIRLVQIQLLLKINMLHLITMILLLQPTINYHHLRIKQLQLHIKNYLPSLNSISHTHDKRISNPRFQQLQKTNCTSNIDVLNRKGT